jgi:hypothetical protein
MHAQCYEANLFTFILKEDTIHEAKYHLLHGLKFKIKVHMSLGAFGLNITCMRLCQTILV